MMPRIAKVLSELSYCVAGFQHVCPLICFIEMHFEYKVRLFIYAVLEACMSECSKAMLWRCKLGQACLPARSFVFPWHLPTQALLTQCPVWDLPPVKLVNWPVGVIKVLFLLSSCTAHIIITPGKLSVLVSYFQF